MKFRLSNTTGALQKSFPIDLATIFGSEFVTFDSQDLAIIGKQWSPENYGIEKNNPLEFPNESMITPCPCSFDKTCRTAECFDTAKVHRTPNRYIVFRAAPNYLTKRAFEA